MISAKQQQQQQQSYSDAANTPKSKTVASSVHQNNSIHPPSSAGLLKTPSPTKASELDCLTVSLTPPSFTTPSLDFRAHSKELLNLLTQIYRLRDRYFTFFPYSGKLHDVDVSKIAAEKDLRILQAVERTLERLNQLTKPPMKKRRKGAGPGSDDDKKIEESPFQVSTSYADAPNVTSTHSFDPTLSGEQKAFYHYLRGHLFNVLPTYNDEAHENLSKAIKLNPKLAEAWNSLGLCFWKKGDLLGAKRCFEGGLQHSKNKDGLRHLAMVLRQLSTKSPAERRDNIETSLQYGKEAIAMDMSDSLSWFGLANAYTKMFFEVTFDRNDLKRALGALNKALDDADGKINPDIWYSRAELHHFSENYAAALVDYREAIRLDPTMMTTNRPPVDEICTYLGKMDELIHKRANLKPKKFQSCISSLSKPIPNPVIFQNSKTNTQIPFTLIPFATAKVATMERENVNAGKAVRIKLLGEIKSRFIHRSFIGADGVGNTFGVSIFNLGTESVKVGDELIVADPDLTEVAVQFGPLNANYKLLRVENPMKVFINGKQVEDNLMAWTELRLNCRSS